MAQCKAKARSTSEQCKRHAVGGYTVCQVHGAGSPKQGRPGGVNKVLKANGRYSKHLPTRLAARYEDAQDDPALLELRDDIALLDTRLGDILNGLQDGDTKKLWADLYKDWMKFEDATRAKDTEKQSHYIQTIGLTIKRGNAIYQNWNEAYGVLDQRRRTVESERKRLTDMQQMITVERMMMLIAAIASVMKQHIDDSTIINAIQYDIQGLIQPGS